MQNWFISFISSCFTFMILSNIINSKMNKLSPTLILVIIILQLAESTQPPFSCGNNSPSPPYPFCNTTFPTSERVEDLVSRLTLAEKVSQLVNSATGVARLGVSDYEWWSEALHGVSRHGKGVSFNGSIKEATMFPQIITTASSFDDKLWYRIAQAIGREARAMYNGGQVKGLTFWAPNINIFRDPRWGRGQETPGEDPLVARKYAVSYVRGIQGDSFQGGNLKDGHLQISACCKHFTAYDLDNWTSVDRYSFDAHVTKQDLADTYQPPFQSCVQQGQASGIMCAYNRVNGIPNCADYNLLTKTARGLWGFQGYIASDCDAVAIMHDVQGYAKLPEDAAADVLKAGMDVDCGNYLKKHTESAIQQKKMSESDIDRALRNLFSVQMRLGLFNGDPKGHLYGDLGADNVCSEEHQDLALEAARDGIVLLKNSGNLLPLSKIKTMSVALIGPNANNSQAFLGNYEGFPCKNITLFQALQGYVRNTKYNPGCDSVNCSSIDVHEAVNIAKKLDYVVLLMGLDQSQEREKHDRVDLVLPGKQQNLIESVAEVAKNPVVLVLLCGGPLDVSFAKENSKIGSILWAGYPGEAGGVAIAEIIFGDHNPGAKLPMTWYPKDFIKVAMTDMRMRPDPSTGYPGRTYRFYTCKKVYEFGYGLSYSNYVYDFISVSRRTTSITQLSTTQTATNSGSLHYMSVSKTSTNLCEKATFSVVVRVQNNGEMAGKHPVLLFLKEAKWRNGNPIKQLVGFQSLRLDSGRQEEVEFVLNPCEHLSRADKDGLMIIEEGSFNLVVGDKESPISVVG